jgi:heme exporter protein C
MMAMSRLHQYANPMRFARLSKSLLPWVGALTVLLLGIGLYWGLVASPADYQQKDSVRIMYIHVPAAWMTLFVYVNMAIASAVGLIWRHPLADIAAKSCAPIGAGFTLIALVTGSLWGQPMWGTWWEWGDARLVSVLVMFFLYLGYMALWQAYDEPTKASRAAAILALVGVVNVPIIHFSVEWWNTLHQPASVFKMGGPSIDASMLWPLLIMALGFMAYFVVLLLWRMRAEILARRIHVLMMQKASA